MMDTIVAAVDGSDCSTKSLELASQLAAKLDARLILCHALMRDASLARLDELAVKEGFLDEVKADLDASLDLVVEGTADEVEASLVEVIPEYVLEKIGRLILRDAEAMAQAKGVAEISSNLVAGDPARGILETANAENADLIVIGSRGYGDLTSMVLDSVSHKVLHEADCPCLIVR
jgi:nucleotide-binding universal stress UspA family protein